MYDKILVPVDGSPTSARGYEEAVALARALGSGLVVLHVIDPFPVAVEMVPATTWQEISDGLRQRGETLLAAAKETATAHGVSAEARLVEGPDDLRAEWLVPGADVGVTASASTPEDVVQACVARLRELGGYRVEPFRLVEETIAFPLPAGLLDEARARGVDAGPAGRGRPAPAADAEASC